MRAIDFLIPPLVRCQVGISHVSDSYPIGAKQNVNKHDSALHVETFTEDGHGRRTNPKESCQENIESSERLLPNVQMFC